MRVIICGAGQVGHSIASYLAREDNDVTVIDIDTSLIGMINEELDVNGIVGHASKPDILARAGAADADMIIAVTHTDEVNMVACQVAHSLFNVPKKIARIRDQAYRDPAWFNLFSRSHMPIDVIISPEVEVAHAINQRLSVPGTTNVVPMADGKIYLVGVACDKACPVINTPLRQLSSLFPDLSIEVVAILRGNKAIIPGSEDQMLTGDEVYFVVDARHLNRAMAAFGHEEPEARRILIIGGGNIGAGLAGLIRQEHKNTRVKIIEIDPDRALEISEELDDTIVLQGDGLHKDILEEANIAQTETLVAVTDDDEANILGSLLAKQFGCERVITLINKNIYTPLMNTLGIDATVSPRAITVSRIMQHVRRGRIKAVHNLRDGFAEVIEAVASETSSIINKQIKNLNLPRHVIIGAILREETVIMPKPDTIIRPGDRVVVLAAHGQAARVEQLFSVQVDLF